MTKKKVRLVEKYVKILKIKGYKSFKPANIRQEDELTISKVLTNKPSLIRICRLPQHHANESMSPLRGCVYFSIIELFTSRSAAAIPPK